MCSLIVFLPLARGAMHPWAWAFMQIGICICVGLLITQSLKSGCPVFEKTPLTRPLMALLLLAGISTLFSEYKLYAWEGLLLMVTYIGAYFTAQTVIRTRKQQRILVYTIIATALSLCAIGFLKRFSLNPFSFWDYNELKYSSTWVASTYTNHNHLAGFLEIAIPFVLALFLARTRPLSIKLLLSYIIVILLVTQALTLSRGGWISTIISLVFMLTILFSQRGFKSKKLLAGIVCTAMIIGFFILVSTPVVERSLTLFEQDKSASMEGRIRAWEGTLKMISDYPWLGTGPGTYEAVFTKYQPAGAKEMFIQAHNDYLQAVSDFGAPFVPLLLLLLYCFFKVIGKNTINPSRQAKAFSLAVLVIILAITTHSFIDFNMHIPANAFSLVLIVTIVKESDR